MKSERLQRAERAAEMRSAGMLHREIGKVLGLSTHYVASLLADPDGSKDRARKDRYRKPCPLCGKLMDGSNGPKQTPKTCKDCAPKKTKIWTRELIIESFQAFQQLTGRVPTTADANGQAPSIRAKMSPERVAEVDAARELIHLPHPTLVAGLFGSWPDAVRAAGLQPAPTGGTAHRGRRPKEEPT